MPGQDISGPMATEAEGLPVNGQRRVCDGDTVKKQVGRVDSLVCFEITDDELKQLEDGSPYSTLLSLALFFFGAGVSLSTTFFAATYSSIVAKAVFACVTVVAFLAGVTLVVIWWGFYRYRTSLFAKIRRRRS